ncbi:MAG: sulfurtransferase, partial [Rhodospirillales bacterium]|nr:sulfurtransferase [Rhodospirillales bacterium]
MYANPDSLVSTEWLAEHIDAPDVRMVDATWFMPGGDRNAR